MKQYVSQSFVRSVEQNARGGEVIEGKRYFPQNKLKNQDADTRVKGKQRGQSTHKLKT